MYVSRSLMITNRLQAGSVARYIHLWWIFQANILDYLRSTQISCLNQTYSVGHNFEYRLIFGSQDHGVVDDRMQQIPVKLVGDVICTRICCELFFFKSPPAFYRSRASCSYSKTWTNLAATTSLRIYLIFIFKVRYHVLYAYDVAWCKIHDRLSLTMNETNVHCVYVTTSHQPKHSNCDFGVIQQLGLSVCVLLKVRKKESVAGSNQFTILTSSVPETLWYRARE